MLHRILIVAIILTNLAMLQAQPKLEFVNGNSFNWMKKSTANNPLTVVIKIKNSGDQKLIISEVSPQCHCTTADLDKKELEPGEVTLMHVSLITKDLHGKVSKEILFTSNDPSGKIKTFHLFAIIYNPIDIIPGTILPFGMMRLGKASEAIFIIKNYTEETVKISDFKVNPPNLASIDAQSEITLPPGKDIKLTIKATPDKIGDFDITIDFKTTNKDYEAITIKCSGQASQ